MKRAEILAKLKDFGEPIGADYQQSRGTAHPRLITKVGAGMCGGASVDWIRRVLTGGKGAGSGNPFPAHPEELRDGSKSLRQYSKAAALQLLQSKAQKDAFYSEYSGALTTAFNAKQDQVNQAIRNAGMTFTDQVAYDTYVKKVKDAFEHWQKTKYGEVNTKEEKFRRFWSHYCNTLTSRVGRNPEHRLSNLAVVDAVATRRYDGGLKALFLTVLKAIEPGQAAMVGVSPPIKDVAGHAIAIHCLAKGKYRFFDPNFGVYSMDTRGLFQALLFLFGTAYPSAGGEKGDFHEYEVDGCVEGDYVIFRRK